MCHEREKRIYEKYVAECVTCEYVAHHDFADMLLACGADEDCKVVAEAELADRLI